MKNLREILAFILIMLNKLTFPRNEVILSIYFHNPSKILFEKIIKWLVANGYKFISVKELESFIQQKNNGHKLVFLSFDDGWKGNLKLIDTIEKFNVPITIFIPASAVLEGNYWWEYALKKGQKKYLGIERLKDFKKITEDLFKEKISNLKKVYTLNRSCISLADLKRIGNHELITIGYRP